MNIRELKCFQVVFRTKSINSAAKDLYITGQGLGRVIDNLEKELGVILFKRSAKGLKPTQSAVILYEYAGQLIGQFEVIEQAIRQNEHKEARLNVYCSRGVLNALSFQVLSDFMECQPGIELIWKEQENSKVKEAVKMCRADIGLVVGGTDYPEICEKHLSTNQACILVYRGHAFFERQKISLAELAGEKIITLSEQYRIHHDFILACKKVGITPNIVGMTEDSHFLYKMCKQKIGLGVVLDFSVDEFNLEGIRMIPLKEKITWDVFMICRKENLSYPNIALFSKYLEERRNSHEVKKGDIL